MRGFKITTVESRSLEPPDNSKQKSFPSPQSNTVLLFTSDFSKYLIFRTNFRFPWRFEKSGFNRNFGMIIRSLDVRIVNVFVLLRFECVCATYALGHCVIFFGQYGHRPPRSEGAHTPMCLDIECLRAETRK